MDKSKVKKLIVTLIAVFIIIYVIYVFISSVFDVSSVETEIATEMTASDSLYKEGIIIREETLVKNDVDGVTSYIVADGDQVAKGEKIAKIYASEEDVLNNLEIENINDEIARLKKLNAISKNVDLSIDTIDGQIGTAITDFNSAVANRDFISADKYSDNLNYLITERLVITGSSVNISEKISELSAEKQELSDKTDNSVGNITAEKAGCFLSSADGYESSFSCHNASDINVEQFNKMLKAKPEKISENTIGKIISDTNWYIVCPVTEEEILKIAANGKTSLSVNMPFAYTESIPATVVSVNQDKKSGKGVLIIKCDYMNSELAAVRRENLEICINTYKGIRVSKNALHNEEVTKTLEGGSGSKEVKKKKVQGVYVLYGNELQFKEVSILYSGSDFVICDPSPDDGVLFNGETIALYDNIVTKGSDLKDGKVIN